MPETTGGPTLGEVVRRLDEAVRELREMRREMAESQLKFEATFLRKTEHEGSVRLSDSVIRGVENEMHAMTGRVANLEQKFEVAQKEVTIEIDRIEERRRADRMWLIGGLVFPLIVGLALAVVLSGGGL